MSGLTDLLRHTFHSLLATHPLIIIAALIFFEEIGVPSPVPGDLMMLLAGVLVAQHAERLWVVLLVQELATVAGASGLFAISRRIGRPFVARYGGFVHLTPTRLDRFEVTVKRLGGWATVLGRLIPGLRILTPIVVGVLGQPYRVFLPALAFGGFLYVLALTLVGFFVGPIALAVFERISLPVSALLSFAALVILVLVMKRARDALREERALFVGVIAGVMALLVTNGIVGFLRFGFRLSGSVVVLASTGVGSGWHLLLGWPVFLLAASLIGAAYHLFDLHRLSATARVGLLALPPLLVVLLVIYPFAEGHALRVTRRREDILLAVEVVRWLAFGIALNALMPVTVPDRPTAPIPEALPSRREERDG